MVGDGGTALSREEAARMLDLSAVRGDADEDEVRALAQMGVTPDEYHAAHGSDEDGAPPLETVRRLGIAELLA